MIATKTYLRQVLSTANYHIPLEANFVIGLESINTIIEKINKQVNLISGNKLTVRKFLKKEMVKNDDLLFATGVTLPGESITEERVGASTGGTVYGGLLSAPVLKGRKNLVNFEMSLIETNDSFIDYVMRPWVVAVSQFGLFARNSNSDQNFKTKVTISFLDRTSVTSDGSANLRKTIVFENAAPLSVGGYEVSYGNTKSTGVRFAKTTWTYTNYRVS